MPKAGPNTRPKKELQRSLENTGNAEDFKVQNSAVNISLQNEKASP